MAGFRPGFGRGGTTHSLVVILKPPCGTEPLEDMCVAGLGVLIDSGLGVGFGRIAIGGGAVEHEVVEVETLEGEATEAGLDTEAGEL